MKINMDKINLKFKIKGVIQMLLLLCFSGCVAGSTRHIPAISNFNADRYFGVWYEIARADHRFERNLTHVTATYSRRADGQIHVLNRGYNTQKEKWVEAEARASFRGSSNDAELSVTFFWPFSAQYRIIEIGDDYEYAVVTSRSLKYFWVLSREPVMAEQQLDGILERAEKWGFDTQNLIRVDQSKETKPSDQTR